MSRSWHAWQNRVLIGETPVGKGVFAKRAFRRGEVIGVIQGIVCDDPQYGSPYCMDLGGQRTLEPIPPFRYVNHSCQPNAEIIGLEFAQGGRTDQLLLEALEDILAGAEIRIDYAWRREHAITCQCGSPNCRGLVVSAEEVQQFAKPQAAGTRNASALPFLDREQ
jgi:hypothetical protein